MITKWSPIATLVPWTIHCPPDRGISTAPDINCRSVEGVLGDADRDHISTMVLYPSLGLCDRASKTRNSPPGSHASTTSGSRISARRRPAGSRRRRHPDRARARGDRRHAEAKDRGLVATLVPPALKTRNLDYPDLDPFYAAAVELDMLLGIHGAPGIHLPKIGVDRFTNYIQVHCVSFPFDQMTAMTALISAVSSIGIRDCGWPSSRRASAGCRSSSTGCTSISKSEATDRARVATRPPGVPAGRQHLRDVEPEEPILPGSSTCSATTSSCSPATTRTGRRVA